MQHTITTASVQHSPAKITLRPEADKIWRLHSRFYDVNPQGPVCIVVPGFRAPSIKAENNARLYNAIASKDMSVFAFNYSGCRNFKKINEDATFESHVEDIKTIISFLGDRPHMLLSQSYGINTALAAANEKTLGLTAALAAPDFVNKKLIPKLENLSLLRKAVLQTAFATQGFFCSKKPKGAHSNVPFIKLTKTFIDSAKSEQAQLEHITARMGRQFPISIVLNDEDEFSKELGAWDLSDRFREQGFPAQTIFAHGDQHDFTDDTIAKTVQAALEIARPDFTIN